MRKSACVGGMRVWEVCECGRGSSVGGVRVW